MKTLAALLILSIACKSISSSPLQQATDRVATEILHESRLGRSINTGIGSSVGADNGVAGIGVDVGVSVAGVGIGVGVGAGVKATTTEQ